MIVTSDADFFLVCMKYHHLLLKIPFDMFYLWLVKLKGSAFPYRATPKGTNYILKLPFSCIPTQLGEPVLEMLAKPSRVWIGEWEDFKYFLRMSCNTNLLNCWWCPKGHDLKKTNSPWLIYGFTSEDAGFWKEDPNATIQTPCCTLGWASKIP